MGDRDDIRNEITVLLTEYKEGDKELYDKLFNMVYGQLKKVAHNIKFHNSDQQTLNTTALVHEAYIKLINTDKISWKSRQHFYSLAAKAIRQILIDGARKKQAKKRNPDQQPTSTGLPSESPYDVEALEFALRKMEKKYETVSKIIEYRFFVGLTIKETAELLQISPATVKRNWAMGKMWLYREIKNLEQSQQQILLD
jgi:RNA polymerase sigma factor (TIGR02999 family)